MMLRAVAHHGLNNPLNETIPHCVTVRRRKANEI